MSIAQNILTIIKEHVPPPNEVKVRNIKLKIGELAGVVSDSLEFCFSTLVSATTLRNAKLEIDVVPITIHCSSCQQHSTLEYGIFLCSSCGSSDTKLITGNELQIVTIELDD